MLPKPSHAVESPPPEWVRLARPMATLAVIAWIACVAIGFYQLWAYSYKGAPQSLATEFWPPDSSLEAPSQRCVLLMFLHPECPCSLSTLSELDRLRALLDRDVDIRLLFVRPALCPEGWERGRLWNLATDMRGVSVAVDADGREARRFRARVSGETLLFDANGRLMFSGGLTDSRGHEGTSLGAEAVLERVAGRASSVYRAPVLGCGLLDPTDLDAKGGR